MNFSVLMSVYKSENVEFLNTALKSIFKQTLMPNEIVIVKDGVLTDELELCLEKFCELYGSLIKIVPFSENRGLGLALRDGVLACSYEYIARMDTDDIAYPNRFEKQFQYLQEHKDIDLLGSWVTEFSTDSENPDTITKLPCDHNEILKYAKRRNPFRHMTVVFKKNAVLDSGNYRNFLWFEDYDLWVRMIQNGCKTANIPLVLVNVRADDEMFARRGGWNYFKQEVKFNIFLFKCQFISLNSFFISVMIRGLIRFIPNKIRSKFYTVFLRQKI